MRKVLRFGHGSQRAVPWPSRICRVSGFLARSSRSWFSHPTTQLAMVMTGGWFKWHCFSHISSYQFKSFQISISLYDLSWFITSYFWKIPKQICLSPWFIMVYHDKHHMFVMVYHALSKQIPSPGGIHRAIGLRVHGSLRPGDDSS